MRLFAEQPPIPEVRAREIIPGTPNKVDPPTDPKYGNEVPPSPGPVSPDPIGVTL